MRRLALIVCVSLLATSACADASPTPSPEPIELGLAAAPELGGLAQELAQRFTQRYPYVTFQLSVMAADAAAQAVTERTADAALVAEPLASSLPNLEAVRIGRRAVAIVVHTTNPLEDLTWEQLRAIYTGEIWDWATVAPSDSRQPSQEIVVITQHAGAASRAAFDRRVLNGQPVTPRALVATGDRLVLDLVAEEPAAIGYRIAGWGSAQVKAVAVEGIEPSPSTVSSEQWPITRPINLVTHVDANVYVLDFVDFARAESAQQLITTTYGQ
jgi:phosphate transport system substrate-binding protein